MFNVVQNGERAPVIKRYGLKLGGYIPNITGHLYHCFLITFLNLLFNLIC